ncbi:MAG: metallophosphoesterase [Chloroflexi bacterium]|nr:metallophosphoesterase [Chloroflexota bacterium]
MPRKTILHASDTHFGYPFRPQVAERFVQQAHELAPDLLVISGDLTQRARPHQYRAARQWLDRLPQPLLVVPGNHDVPLFNLVERLRAPVRRYRQYISPDLEPVYEDGGLLAIGLCSARAHTTQNGWLLPEQIAHTKALVAARTPQQAAGLVVHHHFVPVPGTFQKPIANAAGLLQEFDALGADLLLVGHCHRASVHRAEGGLVLVQAGTTTSTRGKSTDRRKNNFHLIHLDSHHLEVTRWQWDEGAGEFQPLLREGFHRRTPPPFFLAR